MHVMERVAGCTVGVKDSPVGVKPRAQHELTLPEVEWGTMDTCRPPVFLEGVELL